jgi:hypothetical protein
MLTSGSLLTTGEAVPTSGTTPTRDQDDVVTTTVTTDPDDTPGALDIAAVRHRVRQLSAPCGAVRVRWTVRTQQPFDQGILVNRHRRFTVELDTDGEPGAERNVRLVVRDGRVVAEVVSNATRQVIATMSTQRTDGRTLSFVGDKGLVGARRYFWYSDFHSRNSAACGRGDGFPITCQDSVPDDGWIRVDRPGWPEDPE